MENGFLILVFIAIAVINGIGQKRRQEAKKRQQRQMGGAPRPPIQPEASPEMQVETKPAPELTSKPRTESGGSEGLIPSDVWEEILGLARGKPPTAEPEPSRPSGTREPAKPSRHASPAEVRPRAGEAPVRGRRPRPRDPDRIRSGVETRPVGVTAPAPPAPAAAVAPAEPAPKVWGDTPDRARKSRSRLFGDGSIEELRKAIILKEVLGPPLALRDEVD